MQHTGTGKKQQESIKVLNTSLHIVKGYSFQITISTSFENYIFLDALVQAIWVATVKEMRMAA